MIEYRALNSGLAAAYREIRLRALKGAPDAYSSSYETQQAHPLEFFADRCTFRSDNFIIGAMHRDAGVETIVGTGGGYVDPEIKRAHIGYVVGMWVEPDHRGLGIARAILRRVMAQLRAVRQVTRLELTVTANNRGALALYESEGFAVWGREPDAINVQGKLHDDLHMSLRL